MVIDPAGADQREVGREDLETPTFIELKGTVRDCYEHENSKIHEDGAIDEMRMKEFMEDHLIFQTDTPLSLKASQESIEAMKEVKRLLPARVFGFVLRTRTWAELSVPLVKDLSIKQDGFDQLVLPAGHKELVRALVKTHSRGPRPATGLVETNHQVDIVRGKGRGLIIRMLIPSLPISRY